jgi:hypothetical protein
LRRADACAPAGVVIALGVAACGAFCARFQSAPVRAMFARNLLRDAFW